MHFSVCLWQVPVELVAVHLLFQEQTVTAPFMTENQMIYSTTSNFIIILFLMNNISISLTSQRHFYIFSYGGAVKSGP